LKTTSLSLDQVADTCGFRSAEISPPDISLAVWASPQDNTGQHSDLLRGGIKPCRKDWQ